LKEAAMGRQFCRAWLVAILPLFLSLPVRGQTGAIVADWPVPGSGPAAARRARALGDATNPVPFIGVAPCRIVDTRGPDGAFGGPALAAGVSRNFTLPAGPCAGLPTNPKAYSLNVTVTNTLGPGFIKIYPQGGPAPVVSTLNYVAGQTVANAAIVPAGTGGGITVVAGVSGTDLIIDINGYFSNTLGNPGDFFRLDNNSPNLTMQLTNSNTSCSGACGLYVSTASGHAIYGDAFGSSSVGVFGNSASYNGVWAASGTWDALAAFGGRDGGYLQGSRNGLIGASISTITVGTGVAGAAASGADGSAGVFGVANNTIGGRTYGVYGTTSSPGAASAGVYGYTGNTTTLSYGVHGSTIDTFTNSAGVFGSDTNINGIVYGVLGASASNFPNAGGVRGVDLSNFDPPAPLGTAGVIGDSEDYAGVIGRSRLTAVFGQLYDGSDATLQFGLLGTAFGTAFDATVGPWGVFSGGNFGATGAKHFVEPHPRDPKKVILYSSLEGREVGTYFRGTVTAVSGRAVIDVPEDFRIVTSEEGLTVQVTPLQAFAQVYVESKDLFQIVVRTSRDVMLDYFVHGVRRAFRDFDPIANGYEFMPRSPADRMPAYLTEEARRRLISNGTYNEDGTVNMATAERAGWTKIWAEREARARAAAEKAAQAAAPPAR